MRTLKTYYKVVSIVRYSNGRRRFWSAWVRCPVYSPVRYKIDQWTYPINSICGFGLFIFDTIENALDWKSEYVKGRWETTIFECAIGEILPIKRPIDFPSGTIMTDRVKILKEVKLL